MLATETATRTWILEPRLYDWCACREVGDNYWQPWPVKFVANLENLDGRGSYYDLSETNRLMAWLFARRDDNKTFFVPMQVPLDASDELKEWMKVRAREKLDTYLDDKCECETGRVCDWHVLRHGAAHEEGGQVPLC